MSEKQKDAEFKHKISSVNTYNIGLTRFINEVNELLTPNVRASWATFEELGEMTLKERDEIEEIIIVRRVKTGSEFTKPIFDE